jgi:hypothetical protein
MRRRWFRRVSISKMYFSNFSYRVAALAMLLTLVTACGGGGNTPAPTISTSPPALNNVIKVSVDGGPANSGSNVNRLYLDVTICSPGSSTHCQTIDHVLVDTGSAGLRLLSSVITPGLNLGRLTGTGGFALLNCVQFVDNTFAWGPVATADIVLGGKTAASVPIQIIADPVFDRPAAACAVGGTAIDTLAVLGATGIIGLGLLKEDCGAACVATAHNGSYYTCTDASCTTTKGATAVIAMQLKNPVSMFASDNNGVLIDLPAVSPDGASSLNGSLIFGINTQANNQLTSGRVLTTDAAGNFSTLLAGQNLNTSFIDSGSNGNYFDSATIPPCSGRNSSGFYCPGAPVNLLATLVGANAVSTTVSFSVDNASTLFADASKAVLPSLSGPMGDTSSFDWGLPFFYGRRVFIGIEEQASSLGTGPFYAF